MGITSPFVFAIHKPPSFSWFGKNSLWILGWLTFDLQFSRPTTREPIKKRPQDIQRQDNSCL